MPYTPILTDIATDAAAAADAVTTIDAAAADSAALLAGLPSLIDGRKTQFVDGANGDDTNAGTTVGAAVATITQAVYNIDSGGRIVVLPGTYDETVNTTFSLRLIAALTDIELVVMPGATITNAAAVTMTLGSGNVLCGGGTVINTNATGGAKKAIIASNATNVRIADIRVQSVSYAMYFAACTGVMIDRVTIAAGECGIAASLCKGVIIRDSVIDLSGWTQCRAWGIAGLGSAPVDVANAIMSVRNTIRVTVPTGRGGDPGKIPSALYVEDGVIIDEGSFLYATAVSNGEWVQPVCIDTGGEITLRHSVVRMKSAGGDDDSNSLINSGTGVLKVFGADYDGTKTSGTITVLS